MGNPKPVPPPTEHQFKPGESGNPAGGAKGPRFKTLLEKFANQEITIEEAGAKRVLTNQEVMTMHLFRMATSENKMGKIKIKGAKGKKEEREVLVMREHPDKLKAITTIMERIDGKPEQTINTKIPTAFNEHIAPEDKDL